jgi:uncharacterized protein with PIN domain
LNVVLPPVASAAVGNFIRSPTERKGMAICPHCGERLSHVETELVELRGSQSVLDAMDVPDEDVPEHGQAVASVCPDCNALLDL